MSNWVRLIDGERLVNRAKLQRAWPNLLFPQNVCYLDDVWASDFDIVYDRVLGGKHFPMTQSALDLIKRKNIKGIDEVAEH